MRRRAYLYITRKLPDRRELLVFVRHDPPEPQPVVRIPGGTVEPHESPEQGAIREAAEETGLRHFLRIRLLASDVESTPKEVLHRYFFELQADPAVPDRWEHSALREGGHRLHVYRLFWLELPEARGLHPHYRAYLHLL